MPKQKKALYGYCAVTADFLHIGHIRLFKECKKMCEKLIVGIMTDECVKEYKGSKPLMSFCERRELVESICEVYETREQGTFKYPHDILRMREYYGKDFLIFDNVKHNREGADVLIPYMEGISSTQIKAEYL